MIERIAYGAFTLLAWLSAILLGVLIILYLVRFLLHLGLEIYDKFRSAFPTEEEDDDADIPPAP